MIDLNEKLDNIFDIIKEIGCEDEALGALLMESFGIAINTMAIVAADENHERVSIDADEQIQMVSSALKIDMEELVLSIIDKNNEDSINNNKDADEETLDFITADVDDYENFLKDNEVKDNLEFLKTEI